LFVFPGDFDGFLDAYGEGARGGAAVVLGVNESFQASAAVLGVNESFQASRDDGGLVMAPRRSSA
jgi:hypothetical protein